jgi:putative N6-adenine-specific DNA methylase
MTLRYFFAPCTKGLESVLAGELQALGAGKVEERRGGCAFVGDLALGYAACLWLRTAIRVQEEVARGRVRDRDDLYALADSFDWTRSITALQTLAIDGAVKDSFANDTRFPVLVVKDAIVDQFRKRGGRRPDVDKERPDLPVRLVLLGDEAILYRDLAGESLHKRGYRDVQHKSPLNEALAAGLLLLTEWDRQSPLCDPMCGSATFLIEAAFLAQDRAPGLGRAFAFERWSDLDLDQWKRLFADAERRQAAGAARPLPPLLGNDRHPGAVALARRAARAADVDAHITLSEGDAKDYVPAIKPALVVTNPPYGDRLATDPTELEATWQALGNFLHRQCGGARAFVLSGNPELTGNLGLRADRKWPVWNGPIECRWLRYAIDAR